MSPNSKALQKVQDFLHKQKLIASDVNAEIFGEGKSSLYMKWGRKDEHSLMMHFETAEQAHAALSVLRSGTADPLDKPREKAPPREDFRSFMPS